MLSKYTHLQVKYKTLISMLQAQHIQHSGPDGGWLLTTCLSINAYHCNKTEYHDELPMSDRCIERSFHSIISSLPPVLCIH